MIPAGVTLTITPSLVTVKGPKGELKQALHPLVKVEQVDQTLMVSVKNPDVKTQRALWGLFVRLINNMMLGVTAGFSKQLEINGVGYKVALSGRQLNLELGFSHPVEFVLPAGIDAVVEKNLVTLSGIDKQLVGETAARFRRLRPPEPYKGKGIKYVDEVIIKKAGKTAAKTA